MMREVHKIKILLANGINYRENKRRLLRLREELRERWREANATKWRNIVLKIDTEKDPKTFWGEVGRMLGRGKRKETSVLKNENGKVLKTREERAQGFMERMRRTFRIDEGDNENFSEETEEMVERWRRRNEDLLRGKEEIHMGDYLWITEDLVRDVLRGFNERAPGASGLTRTMLLNAPLNIHKILAEIYTACLATGYFPRSWKKVNIVMIPKANKNTKLIENYRPISLLEVQE